MDERKISFTDTGDGVLTEATNCSPYDILSMCMSGLLGLAESGVIPPPILRAGLDAISADLAVR